MTTYRVPFENGESAFTEKRSRFISHIWRVETEAEAKSLLPPCAPHPHSP